MDIDALATGATAEQIERAALRWPDFEERLLPIYRGILRRYAADLVSPEHRVVLATRVPDTETVAAIRQLREWFFGTTRFTPSKRMEDAFACVDAWLAQQADELPEPEPERGVTPDGIPWRRREDGTTSFAGYGGAFD